MAAQATFIAGTTPAMVISDAITGTLPANIKSGDLVLAFVMYRAATVTPPAGWTLVRAQPMDTVVQPIAVYKKNTTAPSDSSTSVTFTQTGDGRGGVTFVQLRNAKVASHAGNTVGNTTYFITPVHLSATKNGTLSLIAASTYSLSAQSGPIIGAGGTVWHATVADMRLAGGYKALQAGQATSGEIDMQPGYSVSGNYLNTITVLIEGTAVSGTVVDANNSPVQRKVRSYLRETGALLDEALSDPSTGAYELAGPPGPEIDVVCLDDDAGDVQADLILRAVAS